LSYALPSDYMVAAAGNDNLNFVHYPAAGYEQDAQRHVYGCQ
jgi:hypothetical protein